MAGYEPYPKYRTENWARHQPHTVYVWRPYPWWWHTIHAIISLATCMAWLPIWMIHHHKYRHTKTIHRYWR